MLGGLVLGKSVRQLQGLKQPESELPPLAGSTTLTLTLEQIRQAPLLITLVACSHELEPQYSGQSVGNALLNNQSVPNSQFQR